TWAPGGQLLVTDLAATSTHNGQILEFGALGGFMKVFTMPANSLLNQFPADMVFTPNGRFLTANLGPTYPVSFGGPGTDGSIYSFSSSTGAFAGVFSASAFPATLVGTPSVPVTNFSPSQLTLDAGNHAPTASAGNPYAINEGSALTLHAVGAHVDGDPLTYSWDINGDGNFGDAVGANPVIAWSTLKALGVGSVGTFDVKVIVSDNHGHSVESQAVQVTVNPVAATLHISGLAVTNEGAVYTLTL